jgi:hypothetical protein
LPVAVSLKRFFTPLFVLSLGIFISLVRDTSGPPWQPFQPGWSFEFVSLKRAPLLRAGPEGKV